MTIDLVKNKFELLKLINNEKWCYAHELAKELSVKKTELMSFIVENPKLFNTSTKLNNKDTKLIITNIYLNASENPGTEEWLEQQKIKYKNYIQVSYIDYYGHIEGYFIDPDKEGPLHENEWRNTQEKIDLLVKQNIVKKYTFVVGGLSDVYYRTYDYALIDNWQEKLKKNGWEFNNIK